MAATYSGKTKKAKVKVYSSPTSKKSESIIPLAETSLVITAHEANGRYPIQVVEPESLSILIEGWIAAEDLEAGTLQLPTITHSGSEHLPVSSESDTDDEEEEPSVETPEGEEITVQVLDPGPQVALKEYEEFKATSERRQAFEKTLHDRRRFMREAIQCAPFVYFGGKTLSVKELESYYQNVIVVEWEKKAYWDRNNRSQVGLDQEYPEKVARYEQDLATLKQVMQSAKIPLDQGFSQKELSVKPEVASKEIQAFQAVYKALQELKDTLNAYYRTHFASVDWEEWYTKQEAHIKQLTEAEQKLWDVYEQAVKQQTTPQTISQPVVAAPQLVADAYMQSDAAGYAGLDAFAQALLKLEKLLNPLAIRRNSMHRAANQAKKKEMSQAIPLRLKQDLQLLEKEVIVALQQITQMLTQHMKYLVSLQACRFLNTAEYRLIPAFGSQSLQAAGEAFEKACMKHQPVDIEASLFEERPSRELAQLTLIYNEVTQIWDVPFEQFCTHWKTLRIARHGIEKTSALASWSQKEGTCGELMLCLPLMKLMNQVAKADKDLYQRKEQNQVVFLWKPDEVIIQILSGSTRRYKLLTIYESMISLHNCKDALLAQVAQGRILPAAWSALQGCLVDYIIGGVSKKAKEQVRQITTLLHLLTTKPGSVCIGYEAPYSEAFGSKICADILLQVPNQPEIIVIEIESLTATESQKAYTYLTERYTIKQKTMQSWLATNKYRLIVHIPVGTPVSNDQKLLILADGRFWLEQ